MKTTCLAQSATEDLQVSSAGHVLVPRQNQPRGITGGGQQNNLFFERIHLETLSFSLSSCIPSLLSQCMHIPSSLYSFSTVHWTSVSLHLHSLPRDMRTSFRRCLVKILAFLQSLEELLVENKNGVERECI